MSANNKPPEKSTPETLEGTVWSLINNFLPGPWRWVAIAMIALLIGGFAAWSSLPDATKESIIAWSISTPAPASGFWQVDADLVSDTVEPGSLLELTVETDHSGYVWVFTAEEKRGVLLYPQDEDLEPSHHVIEAGDRRAIPATQDFFGLRAGLASGDEVLMVIVTDSPEAGPAWSHLAALRPDLASKVVPVRAGQWGAAQLRYRVR
ncbi:protein of unknown function [uncultured Woeseiaceae bacterium]|uniref:DUF4384 domain-containing protein n=1 Tax=uncultured Woeseiaceae bacterium TaxID=1983305 RepID=A0A7D9D139_9GAMM|nr:protein of unknown function [uncultured Woeseiaceae bacterium]